MSASVRHERRPGRGRPVSEITLEGLAAEVALLRDHEAIRALTARYNSAFDDVEPEAFAAQFTEDGIFEIVGSARLVGRTQIAAAVRAIGFGVVHATTDPVITIDGDVAIQECTLLVVQRSRERAPQRLLATGRYRDTVVRTAEGWKFAHRVADLDRDLLPDPPRV